ncbi:hypothetical protein ISCGN_031574 [Ixodes scapularis]
MTKDLQSAKKKIHVIKTILKRKEQKIKDPKTLVEGLRDQHVLTDELQLKLEAFGEIPQELLKGFEKNATRKLSGRRSTGRAPASAHNGKLVRYVDLGQVLGPHESDEVPMATEALVFMAVGLASPWKIPIGYFLTNGASGKLLKSLLEDAIAAVEKCGLHVKAVVCDGLGANVAMAKLLGCFDLLNSRSPVAHSYKHPFNTANIEERSRTMEAGRQDHHAAGAARRRTCGPGRQGMSVIAFAFTLKSVESLASQLLSSGTVSYLCSYRTSQDHLETFFSCVRQRGGWNNNPSAAQFRHAYRKLLVRAGVQAPASANVAADLEGESLTISQETIDTTADIEDDEDADHLAIIYELGEATLFEFSSEVVKYIGDFVSRRLTKTLSGPSCISMLLDDSVAGSLSLSRTTGGSCTPRS